MIVARQEEKLKLGKGVAFVKSQLRRLRQEADAWEVDFRLMPSWVAGSARSSAERTITFWQIATSMKPPTVNDLARLLADAMRRPLEMGSHRPSTISLRTDWNGMSFSHT